MTSTSKFSLYQVATDDGIKLTGLFQDGDKAKPAVINIHGFTSDFYTHKFNYAISDKLFHTNQAMALVQTRGTGIQTEFLKTDNSAEYIGSFYELIEDSHKDISAHIEFLLKTGFNSIILCGHSLGTIKAVRYMFEGKSKDKIAKLVLLAPFDKNAFIVRKVGDRLDDYLTIARQKVAQGKGNETVPVPEYEDFAISYKNYISWYQKTELNQIWDFYRKDYDASLLKQIKIPVKVVLGQNDEFVTFPEFQESAESVLKFINTHLKSWETYLVKNSNHIYDGFEQEVGSEVATFC